MVTLQQMKYFRELAKLEHLTRTAERLHVTQTTLSNTIINMEKQLGVRLFDRVGRNLQLNEVGKEYYRYINEAMICLENAQRVAEDHRQQKEQSVSVGITSSILWSNLIGGFQAQYRSYTLRQIECERHQFRRMLMDQEIDLLIAGLDDLSLNGLEYRVLQESHLYLCVSKDHPLAQRRGITLKEIGEVDLINLPETSGFRAFCDDLFYKHGISYHPVLECDYTLRGKLVEAGFGAAITTEISKSQNMLGNSNVYIPITDETARRSVGLIWNPRRYLSRAAVDFREYVLKMEL